MALDVVLLLVSLGVILIGAEVFTNGIEWLGKLFKLGEGAVGSILAAVGTAMPETLVPIVAICLGTGKEAEEIGIGAILGAPFMLSTLAMLMVAITVTIKKTDRRPNYPELNINAEILSRDLLFFLIVYCVAITASLLPTHFFKIVISVFLVGAYGYYVYRTLKRDMASGEEDEELRPLYLIRLIFRGVSPNKLLSVSQVILALGLIIGGAHLFVQEITVLSFVWGVPAFILSLIIAPVATELPEKFNSIIWSSRGKDTLALGNITGAMVFQSSIVPTVGILLTPWVLTFSAMLSAGLAILSGGLIYSQIKLRGHLTPPILFIGGGVYILFIILILTKVIH